MADGHIQRFSHQWDPSQYEVEALGVFLEWLQEYPGDRDVMFTVDHNAAITWHGTAEALVLFQERVLQFARSVRDS